MAIEPVQTRLQEDLKSESGAVQLDTRKTGAHWCARFGQRLARPARSLMILEREFSHRTKVSQTEAKLRAIACRAVRQPLKRGANTRRPGAERTGLIRFATPSVNVRFATASVSGLSKQLHTTGRMVHTGGQQSLLDSHQESWWITVKYGGPGRVCDIASTRRHAACCLAHPLNGPVISVSTGLPLPVANSLLNPWPDL